MKKMLCGLMAVLMMAVMFAGCGSKTERAWQEQYDLGLEHMNEGAYQKAVLAFSVAIQVDGSRKEAFLGRAFAYVSMGEYEAAMADYQMAEQLAPDDPEVQKVLADYQQYLKDIGWSEEETEPAPEETQPPVIEPQAPTEATQPSVMETEPPPVQTQPATEAPVQTVQATVLEAESGDTDYGCYHIPRIYIDGQRERAVNTRIYGDISGWVSDGHASNVTYSWGRYGNLLCVVVQSSPDWEDWAYDVYTIDITTGQEVSEAQLLAAYGMDRTGFLAAAREALSLYWENNRSNFAEDDPGYLESLISDTLQDSNVQKAMPYIDSRGELGLIAPVASPAGAESYLRLLALNTGAEQDRFVCNCDA